MLEASDQFKRTSTRCTENKNSYRPSLRHWAKLRVYSLAVGAFLVLKKNIMMYGMDNGGLVASNSIKTVSTNKYLFLPHSKFLKFWYFITFALLIYTAILVPAEFAFPYMFNSYWIFCETLIDFLFFLDVLITLNTSFYGLRGVLVTNRKMIFKEYLKSWMIIDCLSCIPFQLLQETQSANKYLRFTRLNRIYRLFSLLKFLRFTKVTYRTQKMLIIREISQLSFNLITFIIVTSILMHNLTCMWIMVSSLEDNTIVNWLNRYNFTNDSIYNIYFSSIYFIFTTLTTVGYGDIVPYTNEEKIFTILVMAFGIIFYSVLIGKISSMLSSLENKKNFIESKLTYFNDFSQAVSLNDELQSKVKKHILLNANKHYYAIDELEFMRNIPFHLKESISKHLYTTLIQNIVFFRKRSISFLNSIIPKLKNSELSFNEVIYYLGEPAEEVYFINKGRVNFKKELILFRTYHQGSYFGEIELIEGTNRENTTTVGTREFSIFILPKKDFLSISENFPEVYSELVQCAKLRKEKNKEGFERASIFINQDSFDIESSSDLSNLLNASNDHDKKKLLRRDTAVLISVKNDNVDKKRNRALWSCAVEGHPKGRIYKKARTMKATMLCMSMNDNKSDIEENAQEIKSRSIRFNRPVAIDTSKKRISAGWVYNRQYLDTLISAQEKDLMSPAGEFRDKYLKLENKVEKTKDLVYIYNANSKILQEKLEKLSKIL